MGMKENPCAGYVLPASELTNVLPHEFRAEFTRLLEEGDREAAQNLLAEHWPATLPQVWELFRLGDEDTPDDEMEQGTIYVSFDERTLYIQTPTPELQNLQKAGVKTPEYHSWSIWG